ncbi:unnamed protein product [Brassica napus]|uniref:(rape) hypothetical protein n=1 Tax=Brassica napus TaxID=3708 RepID=A0A817AVD6_BRANA|nr:unnamed protein product [Brassica napus]
MANLKFKKGFFVFLREAFNNGVNPLFVSIRVLLTGNGKPVGVKAHGTAKRMAFFPAVREETGIDRARTRREWSRGVCLRWKWRRRWWLSRSCGCY